MNNHPHPRPNVPVQLYLLGGLAIFGLAALWLAAFHAFLQIAGGPQAFFAATLIEAGLIIEALALVKRPKVWYIWMAVAISLVVSGTYNYIQAAAVAPSFNFWQLGTLALGPLSALAFVSLTLGYELAEYQRRLEAWQTDRANWLEARRQEAQAREDREKAELSVRLERIQERERERQEAEALRRYELDKNRLEWEQREAELARRRQERREAHELAYAGPQSQTEPAQPRPEPAQPAQSSLKCDKCERPFGTQSALNAHRRFCAGTTQQIEPVVLAQNGQSANGNHG